jgi:hypothetical protein
MPADLRPIDAGDGGFLVVSTTPGSLLDKMGLGLDPVEFGLPDLLEDGLSPEEQNARLRRCVEGHLFVFKDGRKLPIRLIPKMVEFLADLFYERTQQAILWKPRGGGGSLCAAVLIWLLMVYRHKSAVDFAGSGEQAKRVYEYTTQFWYAVPGMAEVLLAKDPLLSETVMKNGVSLKCCPASEKAARGKHAPVFVADESCQEDPRVGKVLTAAIQGVLSEEHFTVVLLSTFHIPFGFFQEHWDFAAEKGYRRYKWDVYDIMRRCTAGLDTATPDDPKALAFCRTRCPLTERVETRDELGTVTGHRFEGCDGRARDAEGYLPRDNVIKAKVLNAGGETWRVEHECQRPRTSGPIYNPERVEQAATDGEIEVVRQARKAVGIDWGGFAVAVLAARCDTFVGVPHGRVFQGRPTSDIVEYLFWLRATYGDFDVYADAENLYGAMDLENAGFEVHRVAFNKYKDLGIANLERYFDHRKIRIAERGDLKIVLRQLMTYHRDDKGNVVKKDDHGPDALLCAMLAFLFIDEFDRFIEYEAAHAADDGEAGEVILL